MPKHSSVRIAKERLEALVVSDRVCCRPEEYDLIRRDLYRTLSRYMELAEDKFQVSVTRTAIHINLTGENH